MIKVLDKEKDVFIYYLTEEEKELLLDWFKWKDSQVGNGSKDRDLVSYIKKGQR